MSTNSNKNSPKSRKLRLDDKMKHEIVAQVHKSTRSTTSSENDYANSEDNLDSFISNKFEDKNENIQSIHTPSVDISVDGESQINSKIMSLIETEMKRDVNNKQSHFTDSRPQSLSFYEDEKMPEELSGNLELLSPEERRHYKRRKEYLQMDADERLVYNAIQDLYNARESEELGSAKKKSRRKRHEAEAGMGDSREMILPKEKRKSKKKRRETSPNSNNKRKHRRKEEEYEPKNEITLALEELQDDVFENHDEFKSEKVRKSPRRAEKLYVQKKNKFEQMNRNNNYSGNGPSFENQEKSFYPLDIALSFQLWWMRLSTLCHGLLGGLALGHWLYLVSNYNIQDKEFLMHYSYYSNIYVGLFFGLCVVCIISVFDRIDLAHLDFIHLQDLLRFRKSSLVILIYIACLVIHLSAATLDDKISLLCYNNETLANISSTEIANWNHMSLWRTLTAFSAWLFVGLGPQEDMLFIHLKNMQKYLPPK